MIQAPPGLQSIKPYDTCTNYECAPRRRLRRKAPTPAWEGLPISLHVVTPRMVPAAFSTREKQATSLLDAGYPVTTS